MWFCYLLSTWGWLLSQHTEVLLPTHASFEPRVDSKTSLIDLLTLKDSLSSILSSCGVGCVFHNIHILRPSLIHSEAIFGSKAIFGSEAIFDLLLIHPLIHPHHHFTPIDMKQMTETTDVNNIKDHINERDDLEDTSDLPTSLIITNLDTRIFSESELKVWLTSYWLIPDWLLIDSWMIPEWFPIDSVLFQTADFLLIDYWLIPFFFRLNLKTYSKGLKKM